MFLRRRLAAFAAVIAALAVGGPVALSSAATSAAADPVITGPSCPDGYNGPTNLATGCPYWLMSYTVEYPGQRPVRCAPGWRPPATSQGVAAATARAPATGSAGRVAPACGGVPTAK
jgi:hypothetical protein